MKYINFKRYKFSTIRKNISIIQHKFSKIIKFIDFRTFDFRKIIKYINYKRYNFYKLDIKRINLKNFKLLTIYLVFLVIFSGFVYVTIPIFYNYDKTDIEKFICKNKNIECSIKGKVSYTFFPTPKIQIKDVTIKDFYEKKKNLAKIGNAEIILSVKDLLIKDKQIYKKLKIKNFEIYFNFKNLKKYKNIFVEKNNFIPVFFDGGQIIFFDEENYVSAIKDVNFDLKLVQDSIDAVLKGRFLNDNIYFNLSNRKINDKETTDIIVKMSNSNFLTKANLIHSEKDKNFINGNILLKKDKNKITAFFKYKDKDKEFVINKSNVRNTFLDGEMVGVIRFIPYFGFDLDLNLNSINFTKLYNYFLSLDVNEQENFFKINNKINGKLNLSSEKIYSSYNLVRSFESRIKFNNGSISIDQFIINLGKLGAADILGDIRSDKKFTNFKFESNVFVDNQKKFLSKFGIYNKKNIPSTLYISGNFDLKNTKVSFYEISESEKLNNDDINFIEKEFNYFMLEDGYTNLFRFPKFKEFIKSITSPIN